MRLQVPFTSIIDVLGETFGAVEAWLPEAEDRRTEIKAAATKALGVFLSSASTGAQKALTDFFDTGDLSRWPKRAFQDSSQRKYVNDVPNFLVGKNYFDWNPVAALDIQAGMKRSLRLGLILLTLQEKGYYIVSDLHSTGECATVAKTGMGSMVTAMSCIVQGPAFRLRPKGLRASLASS